MNMLIEIVKFNMWACDHNDDLEAKTACIVSRIYAGGGTPTANLIEFYGDDLKTAVSKAIAMIEK